MNQQRHCLQSFISDTSLGSPDAIDTVTPKHSNGISALEGCGSETKLAFVILRNSVGELLLRGSFNFSSTFENDGVRTILVICRATFACFEPDDASVMSKERIDPPAVVESVSFGIHGP